MANSLLENVFDFVSRISEGSISARGQLALLGWGAVISGVGLTIILLPVVRNVEAKPETWYTNTAIILIGLGVISLTVGALRSREDEPPPPESVEDVASAAQQLMKNYSSFRFQINGAFYISGVTLTLGVAATFYGFIQFVSAWNPDQGAINQTVINQATLGIVPGLLSLLVSLVALTFYRSTFKRLEETSERLEEYRDVLLAYRVAQELPQQARINVLTHFVYALSGIDEQALEEALVTVADYSEEE